MTPSSWLPSRAENSKCWPFESETRTLRSRPSRSARVSCPSMNLQSFGASMPPATPRIEHRVDGSPQQRVGRLERHQMRGFRIRHHDPAVRTEHDQPMRHRVQRAVEALGDAVGLLFLGDRCEQDRAHEMRHLVDGEHERDDEQARARSDRNRPSASSRGRSAQRPTAPVWRPSSGSRNCVPRW